MRAELGREYDLLIAGERVQTGDLLKSVNPSKPSEVVGRHQKPPPNLPPAPSSQPRHISPSGAAPRLPGVFEKVVRVAGLIRERKFEFDAWLVFEAGKTWPEADADVSEAIDFCEYYARQMAQLAAPEPVVQMPGEKDEMVYMPLGVGVIIPPWNFPLAIMAGMTVAALVTGNTVVIKPSSDTPTIAAEICRDAARGRISRRSAFRCCVGSGAVVGDVLVEHPKTRFVSFTGSRDVGLRINELAAKPQKGQIWIKRVVAEMGGKDAIIVDRECGCRQRGGGCAAIGVRLPGPEVFGLLARDRR